MVLVDESMALVDESIHHQKHNRERDTMHYKVLLIVNYVFLLVGSVSSSLLSKFYFVHGGSSRWVATWVQCAGFPLLIPAVYAFSSTERRPFAGFNLPIVSLSVVIGLMLGVNNLLISWGTSYLPVSTSSLVLASQLVFVLFLSAIIVRQKITFANLNCVVLLTLAAVLLALDSSSDKPEGLTKAKYFVGFFCTIGAALLFALYLPLVEKLYRNVDCYAMVVEMQVVMQAAATVLATVGMAIDGGFSGMKKESQGGFNLGSKAYVMTVGLNVVTWQLCFIGTAGMVFLTTSVTSGICSTALMAVNVIAGVLAYGDHMGGSKAVSTVLCVWGFSSYVYGMYVKTKRVTEEVPPEIGTESD
ncbi:probable purine permease 4 [Ipomoea triloba]|uniref:probable purine permease 4 n=1 Tax=Ipomoea triloba TaxID=35885 RepID=UPI00125D5452|nr:probable purine permease 4 [Ipomoea triloba]